MSYFDRLGFADYSKQNALEKVHSETFYYLTHAKEAARDIANVEFVWFSDTIIFYSADDSQSSFRAVAGVSRSFFDELLIERIPVRGALAFGDFYGDKASGLFFGKALVDACKYGEKFNWLGFVLHHTALERMAELGQPVSDLTYKRWDAEYVGKEPVVAYLAGPGSIMPLPEISGNPYLEALEAMAADTHCESHKRKYTNTIEFLKRAAKSG